MAKSTEIPGEDSARQPDDLVGVRSALPFRLERLGEALNGGAEPGSEQVPQSAGATPSNSAGAACEAAHRQAPKAVDVHVGARVRLRRHLLGMSQTKLATALGVTFQQLQKYERGLNRISASRLHDLGRALDTSISYFFDDMPAGIDETASVPLGPGHAGYLNDPELDRLHSREALNLVQAYYNLEDPEVRRHILELMGSLGSPH